MKKVIFVLTVILASIGCTRERCSQCTTSIYMKGLGWSETTEVNCNEIPDMLKKTVFITVDPLTGEILFEKIVVCK